MLVLLKIMILVKKENPVLWIYQFHNHQRQDAIHSYFLSASKNDFLEPEMFANVDQLGICFSLEIHRVKYKLFHLIVWWENFP